tara:strand:+ start:177 stop:287 length:111 start_codon:yes stop_codon:yes gene_type:complete
MSMLFKILFFWLPSKKTEEPKPQPKPKKPPVRRKKK